MNLEQAYKAMQQHDASFKRREQIRPAFGNVEDCKKMLFDAMQLMDATANIQWLPEYDKVAEWMASGEGKGLLLSGDCGRGKSNIIMFALPLLFMSQFQKVLKPIHVQTLAAAMKEKNFFKKWGYAIDEIGSETQYSDYGVKSYPIMDLINEAEIHPKICLFSTNLGGVELLDKYDKRTIDRLARLCTIIKFEGKSLRK